jgi:type IV pilus assembly protein PilW
MESGMRFGAPSGVARTRRSAPSGGACASSFVPSRLGGLDARTLGGSLIDVLVGLAVGLLCIAIVYRVFIAMDGVRRNAALVADTQSNATFALFTLASQIGNAGAATAAAARYLDTCPVVTDVASTLRPIDVLITDGGAADRPDSIVVRGSLAPAAGLPAAFADPAPAGTPFHVQSPDAFAVGDRVAAISRTGTCAMTEITTVGAAVGGVTTIEHGEVALDFPVTSVLLDLGPARRGFATRFDVASGALRSTDVSNGDAPVPLASNVVNFKAQYGIDADGDGTLDTWASAASADFAPATLLAAPRATLERIEAIRFGLVVRTERPDTRLARRFDWVLFDCEQEDKTSCPGRLTGTIAASAAGSYRYRIYETIVPLRNVRWNRGA